MDLFTTLLHACQEHGRTTEHTEDLLASVVDSIIEEPPALSAEVRVDDTGKSTIHITIPPELWEPNEGIEHPNNHRHFAGTLVINGQLTHLEAIQVEDLNGLQTPAEVDSLGGMQTPAAAEYTDEFEALGTLSGDGPFETSTTVEPNQEFVIYAYPYM